MYVSIYIDTSFHEVNLFQWKVEKERNKAEKEIGVCFFKESNFFFFFHAEGKGLLHLHSL